MVTWINTIVGIIGIIVGVIGLINIHEAKELRNSIKTGKNSTVNQVIQNGFSLDEVCKTINQQTDERIKPYENALNSLDEVQKILLEDDKYTIPIFWSGSQDEFDKKKEANMVNNSVMYLIHD